MAELKIGFLFNAASRLTNTLTNRTQMLLNSYYLMRCKKITHRLPQKHFSKSSRCPRCCIEWNDNTETKVKPLQLSKKQKRRIRLQEKKSNEKRCDKKPLYGNILERKCSFCNHSTACVLEKYKSNIPKNNELNKKLEVTKKEQSLIAPTNKINVYSNSKQIFSLSNQKNTLTSMVKKQSKDIKNNKKKKDKFAGLCQRAVLLANKMKGESSACYPIGIKNSHCITKRKAANQINNWIKREWNVLTKLDVIYSGHGCKNSGIANFLSIKMDLLSYLQLLLTLLRS